MIKLPDTDLRGKFEFYAKQCLIHEDEKKCGYIVSERDKNEIDSIFQLFQENKSGIFVYGGTGTGKTLFFDLLKRVIHPRDPMFFKKKNVLNVVLDFNIGGHETFNYDTKHTMLYDDLGTEDKGYRYGEKVEVMEKLIQFRYDLYKSYGTKSFFTSNLRPQELEVRYGQRCWSRLKEMCHHFRINDGDKRELKNYKGLSQINHPVLKTKDDLDWETKYNKYRDECKKNPVPVKKPEGLGSRLKHIGQIMPKNISDDTNQKSV